MLNKYTLSIIIPVYNFLQNSKYLYELLDRFKNQTKSNFIILEIILVNDSPEYKLEEVFVNLEIGINIIIIDNNKNLGQAFSRNVGSSFAKGDFLHFIDQDDLIDTSFYSNITVFDDIIISNCFLFNDQSSILHMRKSKQFLLKNLKNISSLSFFLIFDNIVLSPGQIIVKRTIFNLVGGFPLLKNFGSDDYGFMYNLTNHKLKYHYSINSIFLHRLHPNQGKNVLNMSSSKKEFLNKYSGKKSIFTDICMLNTFPFDVIKKVFYFLFYNRLA